MGYRLRVALLPPFFATAFRVLLLFEARPLPEVPELFEAAFLGEAFLVAVFFAAVFLGAAFLAAAFFGAAFLEADLEELPFREADLEAPPPEADDFLAGTFDPDLRASERPIAMACFREVTFLPLPLFS
jgi:hypothetical protein